MVDIKFDLNAKLEEIRAMNASIDEKNILSGMVANAYTKAFMDESYKKEKTKNNKTTWEDADIVTMFSGIKDAHGERSTWEYGMFKTDAYHNTIAGIAKELNRTEGAIHTLLKIATIGGNISKANKKNNGVESAIRFKKIAQTTGLITEKAFVSALYNGYTDDVLNLEEFVSYIGSINPPTEKTVDVTSATDKKPTVKVSVKKNNLGNRIVGARYTYDERVGIFKKIVSHIGNFKDIESKYGKTAFSGFPPHTLTNMYAVIASKVPNRTTSAIKNTADHAVFVARNPNRKYTQSKTEMYDAAIEAGFII